jgi:beta-glucosidase
MGERMSARSVLLAMMVSLTMLGAPVAAEAHAPPGTPIYLNRAYSFEERAADLVSRMTLAEKASQMVSSQAPAIPRLGIPAYGWWNEALHGVSRLQLNPTGNATTLFSTTSYPIDLSLGASWDADLMYREASAISDEAREVVPNNSLDLDFYSPTINLARDPRWGRDDETFGEDPLLTAQIAGQFVNGMEGKDRNGNLLHAGGGYLKTITTLKHFAANNSEINRRTGSADMDDRTLREYYTAQFRRIVQQAHPGSIMSSYNSLNGTPAAANVYLMDALMRETFGFTGYFTSDCDAIFEMVRSHHWQPPNMTRPINNTERHAYAMSAGEDLDCNAGFRDAFNYLTSVPEAVGQRIQTQTDTFNEGDVDTSLVRLFTARMKLGEFDDVDTQPWVTAARARVAKGTWVNADSATSSNHAVTETPERLALAREAGAKSLVLLKNSAKLLPLQVPASGPYRVAVIGYLANPTSMYLGGYSSIQGPQGVAKEVSPYNGIKSAVQGIDPDASVDFLPGFTGALTTAASLTTVDPAAADAAADYDAVIVYTGTDAGTANEDRDRTTLALPGAQADLVNQVAARNPHTVAVMETIGQVDVTGFEPNVSAMLWSSYNGQRKGEALADVLLGAANPSGHLPFIWYQSIGQIPDITDYAIRPTATTPGRTYMYFNGPLSYPFGHGLSYTDFAYSNLRLQRSFLDANDTLRASVDVTNTGAVPGSAVVQLYVTTPDAPAALERPIKRLKGFAKVALAPGQTKTVPLSVDVPDLAFFDQGLHRDVVDQGRYGVQIATSSADADIQQQRFVHVGGHLRAVPTVVSAKPAMAGDAARDVATRVLFPQHALVLPQLTVAMNDDTLFGYISKGAGKPFPAGMRFRYMSNRPRVAAVDWHGTIRTVGPGVATITASASYAGVTRSTRFVIQVRPELERISVGSHRLSGVSPETHSYDVILSDHQTAAPRVRAQARGASVAVTQASAVPGTATITVTDDQGVPATYKVNFAHQARSDDFASATLGPQWSWVRENPVTHSLSSSPGSLVITPEAGDLIAPVANTARNILVAPALGDWTIQSKLVFNVAPHVTAQQGGIIAYQGDDDYLKLDWEFRTGAARLSETIEDSLSGTAVSQVLTTIPTAPLFGTATTVWLRMVKTGPRYSTYYSTNGTDFTPIYTTGAALTNVKVGLFAFNGPATSADLNIAFDDFQVTNDRPRRHRW